MPAAAPISACSDITRSLAAAHAGVALCELSTLGALRFTGTDAAAFLHAQLTSDVQALAPGACGLTAWCSAKGRVLANGLLHRASDTEFDWLLPGELAPAIRKRLQMFVLRAKVKIEDDTATMARFGVGGPGAQALIGKAFGASPSLFAVQVYDDARVISLPGDRFLVLANPEHALPLQTRMAAAGAQGADAVAWEWLSIRAGVPTITAATQDRYVPQMLNWQLLQGVSFTKGCYPGQEIVARTQYRGRLKERLHLVHLVTQEVPAVGDALYSPAFGDQSCGAMVNVAASPEGGYDALAVVQTSAANDMHWRAVDGPLLNPMPLPYAVPEA